MDIKKLLGVAVLASTVSVGSATAGEMGDTGLYLGLSGVGSAVSDFDFNNNRGGTLRTADFDTAFGGLLRVGYDFGAIRIEVEGGARPIDIDSVSGATDGTGDVDLYTVMINGTWDIATGMAVTPYLSLGAGAAIGDGDISYTGSNGSIQTKDFSHVAPAGQVGVGLRFGITEAVDLTAGYSFLATTADKAHIDETVQVHSVLLGLEFHF